MIVLCNVGVNELQISSWNIAAFSVDKPSIMYLLSWLSFLFKLQDQKKAKCYQIFSLLCLVTYLCEWASNSIYFHNSWALGHIGFGVCSKVPALSSIWRRCISFYGLKGHHILNCFFFFFLIQYYPRAFRTPIAQESEKPLAISAVMTK